MAIAVVRNKAERTVGWVYNDSEGNRIAQVLPIIDVEDREVIHVRFAPRDRVSAFVPFPTTANPWHDLTIHYCSPAEMIPAKYQRVPN